MKYGPRAIFSSKKRDILHISIIQYFLDAIHIMNLYATSIINNCIKI